MKTLIFLFILLPTWIFSQAHNWNSPSEVVKKVKKVYSEIQTMNTEFKIKTSSSKKVSTMAGSSQYKNPGKIRYDFSQPSGDVIASDGKTLWIYIKKIEAVGKQDLEIQKNNVSGEPIFPTNTPAGLFRIFRKYHYKFDSINQPQKGEDGKDYFVLALEQREKIGGFEYITLYVDSKDYLIRKAVGKDSRGKETAIEFTKIELNKEIEDGVFNYHVSGKVKIVNNPLVSNPIQTTTNTN
jgi:outer membrane lipoprotein carrier protein